MLFTLLMLVAAPPVTAVAYSPDGKQVAAGFRDEARVLDAATGTTVRTIPLKRGRVTALAYAPDGSLASADGDPSVAGVVTVTGPSPGDVSVTLTAHKDIVYALAFSPDGKLLATGGYDRTVKLWATPLRADSQPAATLTDHSDAVYALAFSPDGKLLASAGADRTVKVWDAATRKRLFTLGEPTDWVYAVAWHPDGKSLYAGGVDRSLRSWAITPAGGTLTASVFAHEGPVTRVLVGPKGAAIYSVGEDRRVKAWDATLGAARVLTQQPDVIPAAALSPDGTRLALGLFTGSVLRLDAATGDPVKPPASPQPGDRFPLVNLPQAKAIPLPATVVGTLDRAGAVDRVRFAGTAGQELGVELVTKVAGTQFDPVLTLTDAKGRVLAESDGKTLGLKLPAAGDYAVTVRDREYRGGALAYRLNVGPVPVVTSVFPIGVTRGVPTPVSVRGVNLGDLAAKPVTVTATGAVGSQHALPILKTAGAATVTVGEFPSATLTANGMKLPAVPFTVDGELAERGAAQTVTFAAKKGARVVVEVQADRLGSPLDSALEILDAAGKPVPLATLRATATAYTTFRDNTSIAPRIRLEAWNELGDNDFLFLKGELMRIDELPKGPDDDCGFVEVGGKRKGFLGTTPVAHSNGSLAYRVEVHPPGVNFPPNGLPVVTLTVANDDGGDGFGRDSVVLFDPPADGVYSARVRDARGFGGPGYAYRLTVRPPRPDFRLRLSTPKNVWAAGAVPVTVTATRLDGFDGTIRVAAQNLPAGFTVAATTIEAEQTTAVTTLSAAADAKAAPAEWALAGTATIGGEDVTRDAPGGALAVTAGPTLVPTAPAAVTIRPGGEALFTIAVTRDNQFKGRVPFDVRGLPHGVRVMNIGLSGILVLPGEKTREVVLYAEPWVAPQTRPAAVVAKQEGAAPKGSEFAAPLLVQVK